MFVLDVPLHQIYVFNAMLLIIEYLIIVNANVVLDFMKLLCMFLLCVWLVMQFVLVVGELLTTALHVLMVITWILSITQDANHALKSVV